jgi:tetratricopeptide (TPR) repeat protein
MKFFACLAALFLTCGALWAQETGSRGAPADAYVEGRALLKEGRLAEAEERFEEAIRLFEMQGDKRKAALVLVDLARLQQKLGDVESAMRNLDKTWSSRESFGAPERAAVLYDMGDIHRQRGEYARAMRQYEEALSLYLAAKSAWGEAAACGSISNVHGEIGNTKESLRWMERAMRIFAARGDERSLAAALRNMGLLHKENGDFPRARARYAEALELYQKTDDVWGILSTCNNMALLRLAEGDARAAAEALKDVIKEAVEAGVDKAFMAQMHESVAQALFLAGDHEGARREAEAALRLARETGRRETAWQAEHRLGAALARLGNARAGTESLRRAVEGVELLRAGLEDAGQKESFLSRRLDVYESLVELLISDVRCQMSDGGNPSSDIRHPTSVAEAFETAERMKARSFLDELGAAKYARAGVPENLIKEKRMLEARLKWLRNRSE